MAKTTAAHAKPARARPLSRERIVAAAIAVADRDGLGELSMRRLGAELGVDPMAVYRHFRNKDDLLEAMADAVLADVGPPEVSWSDDWVDLARVSVRRFRKAILEHPGVAPLIVRRPPIGPNTFLATEAALTWLRAIGFDEHEAPQAFQALVTLVLGAVSLELSFLTASGSTLAEQAEQVRLTYESLPASRFPNTVAMADHVFVHDADAQFDYGLELLLTGLQARLRANRQ